MAHTKHFRLLALLCCSLFLASECQHVNGTARSMQKTAFSCAGRPAGYYADIETGCQIYHMCDGLGRQFSYTCPNTTLFQQRMLICDHWYMVNCSKAESDYAANLLIGQRDKPFVNDEENNLRTPRPDLLDRPYAPDYSGESFRSQYKQLTPVQNQIRDETAKNRNKMMPQHLQTNGQTRWRIPPPSRTILPPAYEPQIELQATSTSTTELPKIRQTTKNIQKTFSTVTATRKPVVINEALHPRKSPVIVAKVDTDDLGTSHSTRYNTSADFKFAEVPARPLKSQSAPSFNSSRLLVKPPSKIYEPPFLYPIYNQDDQQQTFLTSTAAPFTTSSGRLNTVVSTTARPVSRPTTFAGLPFSTSATAPTTATGPAAVFAKTETRTPTPAQSFRLATPPSTPEPSNQKPLQNSELPLRELLPPFVNFVPHDIATTQGPPIYYEWKVPSNGLEPPKIDPPIGVDGREYPETKFDYSLKEPASQRQVIINTKLNDIPGRSTYYGSSTETIKSHTQNALATRLPTARSIKPEALAQSVTNKAQRRSDAFTSSSLTSDISQLRKELLIPEYAFPLETIGRTGYGAGDVYNSFQLKIPELRNSNGAGNVEAKRRWFGENPKCPECHPSFVIPGTCEPCLQR